MASPGQLWPDDVWFADEYAVVVIDVGDVEIELGVECPDLHLGMSSMSDVRTAANAA